MWEFILRSFLQTLFDIRLFGPKEDKNSRRWTTKTRENNMLTIKTLAIEGSLKENEAIHLINDILVLPLFYCITLLGLLN